MDKRKKLVFATNNAHKLEEARRIMPEGVEIVSLKEIGCHDEIPETAETLEGNALIKARWIHDRYGVDCFADDTGLMVDALGGEPGVRSARYAGEECDPAANMAKLLAALEGESDRRAHFSTVVALIKDGEEYCFEGRVDGQIAETPAGDSGFGYDPVFIADESGKRFAEMSADAKNAISHRGRAMRKLCDFLGALTVAVLMMVCGFSAGAESWRLHSSYDGQMTRMIETGDYVYMLGASNVYNPPYDGASNFYGLLMRHDKRGDETLTLNSQNLLSGNQVSAIEYNREKGYLAVGYDDGNFDMLYDNGDVYNVPGLKLSNMSAAKRVNDICFDNAEGMIYLATAFGYVSIDEELKEIAISRNLGTEVGAMEADRGMLTIGAGTKVYEGSKREFNISGYREIADVGSDVRRLYRRGSRGYVVMHGRPTGLGCTFVEPDGDGGYKTRVLSSGGYMGIEPYDGGLLVSCGSGMDILYPDGKDVWVNLAPSDRGSLVTTYDGRKFWFSTKREGISLKEPIEGNWSVLKDRFLPNLSSAYLCPYVEYSPRHGMLVRNYGHDYNFNSGNKTFAELPDLLSVYKDMTWKRVSSTWQVPDMKGLTVYNPMGIAVDPQNPDHIYCGSMFSGLLRLDMSDISKSIHMSKPDDKYADPNGIGFASIVANTAKEYWNGRCEFSPPQFDNKGVMWAARVMWVGPGTYDDGLELWYWTPENRAATVSASDVRPFGKIEIKGQKAGNNVHMLPLKSSGCRNMLLIAPNSVGEGLIVYDHNGTLDDTSDDRQVTLKNISDQDGLKVDFAYALSLYEDELTGLVWFCTSTDIVTFDPKAAFSNPNTVRRVKVPRNDGTNLADHLLSGVTVNKIITDRDGNKWFATGGGGLVCTSSDGRTILKSYTTDNSAIPNNVVYSCAYNPEDNSIMVATGGGLATLYLSETEGAKGSSDVRAYPNPARPDWHGYVTIDGLPDDAMVKILDSGGNLVKECGRASAGELQWDLTNLGYKKVPAGVYFIVASNGLDSDSYSKVGKVLVVN